ncbi:uncharacterized protein LOC143665409 isoform X5 [Tamandua tetradactyla]
MATTQGITNSCKDTSQSDSPLKTINSACEEKEFSDLTKESPEPGPSGLFQDNRQMAEKDPNSEYHSCVSPEDNPIHTANATFLVTDCNECNLIESQM